MGLCNSWTWLIIFFPIREVFDYNYFRPFLFLYPSGTNIMQMLMRLILSQKSLSESVLISFLFFFLLSILWQWFLLLCLQFTYSFASVILRLTPLLVYFSCQLLYCLSPLVLFFKFSNFLLAFLYLVTLCFHIFSEITDHLYYYFFSCFRIHCLSLLHLAILPYLPCSFVLGFIFSLLTH